MATIHFLDIENIHVMRNSLNKLREGNVLLHNKFVDENNKDAFIVNDMGNALGSDCVSKHFFYSI